MMQVPTSTYLILGLSIVAEVIATTALARSDGLSRLLPSLISIVGYGLAFWGLTVPLKMMNAGIVYAIWSGAGIVLIALVGWLAYGQKLDAAAMIGLGLIVAGVMTVNVFSSSVTH